MSPGSPLQALLLAAVVACNDSTSSYGGGGGGGNPPPPGASSVSIAVGDYTFYPSSGSVAVGTTVRWTNNGPSTHTATSDAGVWDSGNLAPPSGGNYGGGGTAGGSYQHTFSAAGTYTYHCGYHQAQGMTGTITVTP